MADIISEYWLAWGLAGKKQDVASRPPETNMLEAYDARTTNSAKSQQFIGKMGNRVLHAAPTGALDHLPKTAACLNRTTRLKSKIRKSQSERPLQEPLSS